MVLKNGIVSKAHVAAMRDTDKLGKRRLSIEKFVPPDIDMNLKTDGIDNETVKKAMTPRIRPKGRGARKPERKKTDIFALIDHGIEMSPTEEALRKVEAAKAARDAPIPDLLFKPKPKEPEKKPEKPKPIKSEKKIEKLLKRESSPLPHPLPPVNASSSKTPKTRSMSPKEKHKELGLDVVPKEKKSKHKGVKRTKSMEVDLDFKNLGKRLSVRNLPPKRNKSVDLAKKKEKKEKSKTAIRTRNEKHKKERRHSPLKRTNSDDSKGELSITSFKGMHSRSSLNDSIPDFEAIQAIKERRKRERKGKAKSKEPPKVKSFFAAEESSTSAKELKKQIDVIDNRFDEIEKEVAKGIAELKKAADAKKRHLDEEWGSQIDAAKEVNAKKDKTNQDLQSGAQKIIDKLRAENKRLRAEVDKYPPQILEMRKKNSSLEGANRSAAQTFAALRKMARKLEGDHENLHAQNEKCKTQYLPKYRTELRMRKQHTDTEIAVKEVYRDTAIKISNRVTQTRDVDLIEAITTMVIDIEGELNPKFDPKILFAGESDSSDDDLDSDSDSD